MATISTEDPLAIAVVTAIHRGDVTALRLLLAENAGLAASRIGDDDRVGMSRTLLHVATDWPGHFPCGAESVAALVAAGAEVDARFRGRHGETPLHWAASSNDVSVLDALLDAGADIDASGAVIAGGTPLDDATAFAQWDAARRLVERGARVNLFAAASLGLMPELAHVSGTDPADPDRVSDAFWAACHGGQLAAAAYLLDHGAELSRLPGWEELTPLDAAARSGAHDVVTWLHGLGARTASELRGD
ncbi:ankyrin repeat domain-containing protein [Dermatophilaceae bacterium Soc4.6]